MAEFTELPVACNVKRLWLACIDANGLTLLHKVTFNAVSLEMASIFVAVIFVAFSFEIIHKHSLECSLGWQWKTVC